MRRLNTLIMLIAALAIGGIFAAPSAAAAPLTCTASPGREAARIAGEIAGAHNYSEAFGPGWFFELTPQTGGWRARVLDADGLDLAQMTPPLNGPNPRELFGWHFRNAKNDGPNMGDVNAPQLLRLFGFDPRLSGTGGWKPPRGGEGVMDQPGRGGLQVLDYGLADLAPGERARMVYLKFDTCLSWPSEYGAAPAPDEPAPLSSVITPELEEQMRACGLEESFEISAFVRPPELGGDFDGDGSLDIAAPVVRNSDGKRGVAICRAGTWLDVLGLSGEIGEHLSAEYFDHVDWWSLTAKGPVGIGGEGAPAPTLIGDGVTIGKEDSSSVLIYWDGAGWTSYWQGD